MKNKIILILLSAMFLAGCGGGTADSITMPELPPMKTAFEEADTDGIGGVSFAEAQTYIMNKYAGFTISQEQFDMFDTIGDPDGSLSMQEVERFVLAYTTNIVDVLYYDDDDWSATGNVTLAITTNRNSVTEGDFMVIYSDTTAATEEQSRTQRKFVAIGDIEDNPSYILEIQKRDFITAAAISGTFVSKTRISGTLDTVVWGAWTTVSPIVTQGGVTTNRTAVTEGDFMVIYSDTTAIDTKESRSQSVM